MEDRTVRILHGPGIFQEIQKTCSVFMRFCVLDEMVPFCLHAAFSLHVTSQDIGGSLSPTGSSTKEVPVEAEKLLDYVIMPTARSYQAIKWGPC